MEWTATITTCRHSNMTTRSLPVRQARPVKQVRASFFPPIALASRTRNPMYRQTYRPMYRQLYDWFQGAIVSGQLRPGQRVPSTRALAAELKISRLPVLSAFEQLHAEGYFETLVGSGSMVSQSVPDDATRPTTTARKVSARQKSPRKISRLAAAALSIQPQQWPATLGPFRASLPALDHFPMGVWSKLVARHSSCPIKHLMAYGDIMGYMPFREAIAEYLGAARAVRCTPDQVMVVT